MKYKATVEFWIAKEQTHSVSAKSWYDGAKWHWNVYAYIFDNHPLHGDNEALLNLPLHCGCTFDQIWTRQPFDIRYDFQKVTITKVVGSDYDHIYDNYDRHPSPFDDGVPPYVERDALELAAHLEVKND
jgi:hypothetical protein